MTSDPAPVPVAAEPGDGGHRSLSLADLPEPVRARLLAVAAEVLPLVSPLPPAVRRIAAFAPARRARLGARQLAAALQQDDEFRAHVGTQALLRLAAPGEEPAPDPAEADPVDADPVAVAALAWLRRGDDWHTMLDAALERVEQQSRADEEARGVAEAERLRAELADAETTVRRVREKLRGQIEELKADNTLLRRRLGEARAAERAASQAAAEAREQAAAAVAEALASTATQEAEIRRLRSRLDQAERTATAVRRDERADRDDGSVRARVLLDALLDAAQGLRRELALPAIDAAPGDRVEARMTAVRGDTDAVTGAQALDRDDPGLLENYLAVPRARLIVDGYNVSKTGWPDSSLEVQRARLLSGLAPVVARSGAEATVVFDAATTRSRPPVSPPRGLKVLFSPFGMIADEVIRDLVEAEPRGRMVVVVTNDQEVVEHARRAGARPVASQALLALLAR